MLTRYAITELVRSGDSLGNELEGLILAEEYVRNLGFEGDRVFGDNLAEIFKLLFGVEHPLNSPPKRAKRHKRFRRAKEIETNRECGRSDEPAVSGVLRNHLVEKDRIGLSRCLGEELHLTDFGPSRHGRYAHPYVFSGKHVFSLGNGLRCVAFSPRRAGTRHAMRKETGGVMAVPVMRGD